MSYQKQFSEFKLLTNENKNLKSQIEQTRVEIQNLEKTLNMIKSAKFFKLWQTYCKIMKIMGLKKAE